MLQEIEGLWINIAKEGVKGFLPDDIDLVDALESHQWLDGLQVFTGRFAHELQDDLDLVERRVAGEDGLASVHLTQNATHRPHIDGLGVAGGSQQYLRSAVPPRGHVLGHHGLTLARRGYRARQSEIGEFGEAVGVEQDVGGFEVTVDELAGVHIFESFEQSE